VVETDFKDELGSGLLEFKAINIDEKENMHFVDRYQIYIKALILSLVKDGKEVKYKNLDKIWEKVGNKIKYSDYVRKEIADFLKEAK